MTSKRLANQSAKGTDHQESSAEARSISVWKSDFGRKYEDDHHPIVPASEADMLRHLLEAKGVTQAQLGQEAGIAKSTVSEVLAGKKPFSRQMIRKLADYFQVNVSVLASIL